MKRLMLIAAALLVSAGTASADYILIKVDVNKLNFFPNTAQMGGFGGAAGAGGALGMPPGGALGMPPGGALGVPGGQGGKFPGGAGGAIGFPPPGGGGALGNPPGGALGVPPPGGALGTPPGAGGALGVPPPGGALGMPPPGGGALGVPGNQGGGVASSDDANAKWVYAWVEIKNRSAKPYQTPFGFVFTYEHKFTDKGKHNWMVLSPPAIYPPMFADYIKSETTAKEFSESLKREMKAKEKSAKDFLNLARKALSRGLMKEFHDVMKEAEKLEPKHPVVLNYLAAKKKLQQPFSDEDPAQRETIAELVSSYKFFDSERKHYRIYAQVSTSDTEKIAGIRRRLALMEDTLDNFYYWFAMQEATGLGQSARQPGLPKYRLNAILAVSKGEFTDRRAQYGQPPMAGDGFTPRRDNIVILSSESRLQDTLYADYKRALDEKIQEANRKLQQMGIKVTLTPEDLLNGNLSPTDMKKNPEPYKAMVYIGTAQTAALVGKILEDDAERHTVTNEAVRQLLIASEMFPRNVQIPEWMVEGLAAFFETPEGSLYPNVGAANVSHLVSFKHLEKTKRLAPGVDSDDVPATVMQRVVTDAYFTAARQRTKEARDRRDNEDLQHAAKESWEVARSTSWALVYFLAHDRKLHYLFRYGDELNKLPRDMDLTDPVLQRSFAKAFDMQLGSIKMKNDASKWFETMQRVNLDLVTVQAFHEQERTKKDPAGTKVAVGGNTGIGRPFPGGGTTTPFPGGGTTTPFPGGGNPSPFPGGGNAGDLAGSTWSGDENQVGKQKGIIKVSFQFAADGKVTRTYSGFQTIVDVGTWSKNANKVSMKFGDDLTGAIYAGSINAGRMNGTMTSLGTKTNWEWSVTSAGGGNPAPIPGGNPAPLPGGNPSPLPGGNPAPLPGGNPAPLPGGNPAPLPGGFPGGNPAPMPGGFPGAPAGNVPPGWVQVDHAQGRYSAIFPAKTVETNQAAGDGGKISFNTAEVRAKKQAFVVMFSDLPAGADFNNQAIIDKVLDGATQGLSKVGNVVSSTKITLGQYSGREVMLDLKLGRKMKTRIFLAKGRLYQLMVEYDLAKGDPGSDVDTFLNGFKLNEVGGGLPGGAAPPIPGGAPPLPGGIPPPPGGLPGGAAPPIPGGAAPPIPGGAAPPIPGGAAPPVSGGQFVAMIDAGRFGGPNRL